MDFCVIYSWKVKLLKTNYCTLDRDLWLDNFCEFLIKKDNIYINIVCKDILIERNFGKVSLIEE